MSLRRSRVCSRLRQHLLSVLVYCLCPVCHSVVGYPKCCPVKESNNSNEMGHCPQKGREMKNYCIRWPWRWSLTLSKIIMRFWHCEHFEQIWTILPWHHLWKLYCAFLKSINECIKLAVLIIDKSNLFIKMLTSLLSLVSGQSMFS